MSNSSAPTSNACSSGADPEHRFTMVILGLTGSIGMGKSTVAAMFRGLGVPVHDADRTVHRLLARGGAAVAAVVAAFGPDCLAEGGIDRRRLGARVFNDPSALRRLEAILHPLVRLAERRFLAGAARARIRVVALDVPLLFETGGTRRVDATVVVSAPAAVQRARVLGRAGMTAERLARVLAHQWPDRRKRRLADFVVPTGLGKRRTRQAVARIITQAHALPARQWPPHRPLPCYGADHARNRP
jgi:dephospho-CoA kinase